MTVFNVLKKNRKYFAALKDGYKCRIVIDEISENIELGENDLEVDDISVITKYGTDLIFQVVRDTAKELEKGICTFSHNRYNVDALKRCRELNGKWDADSKVWVFPSVLEAQIEEVDVMYNTSIKYYDVVVEGYAHCAPYYLAGYKIATATGRDSGAILANDVILLSGTVKSGGSAKNWETKVDGVIRIELSKQLAEMLILEGFCVTEV